ncbi:hypothetical protein [Aquimarina rubra]|uniref:Uncharacterized protein n=1 Tax=Aquimarina rubra TaxID=1920033 RepID=A0ABW5LLI5_9FLAO
MNSKKLLLHFTLILFSFIVLSCDSDNTDTPDNQTTTFMTAEINGVSYDNMKPFGYPSLQSATEVYTLIGQPGKFLRLEGNQTINNNNVTIELFIEEQNWNVGTYDLIAGRNVNIDGSNSVTITISDGSNVLYSANDNGGIMKIDDFDLVNKRIKGTFSFPYNSEPTNGTPENFEVTNGYFDFPLDDPEF